MEALLKLDMSKVVQDERVDPRLRAFFKGKVAPNPPWVKELVQKEGLDITTHEVPSQPDGNEVTVTLLRPAQAAVPLPCVMYLHGGGMAVGSVSDVPWRQLTRAIARQGVVVAAVDFRNSTLPSRPGKETARYPGGLNDCMSVLRWLNASKDSLGIGERIVAAGESGGGNLTLAVAMRCKKEGRLDLLQGFFATCPYIAGSWPAREGKPGEILGSSHLANAGILLTLAEGVGDYYGRRALEERDPLAWPGFATAEDVRGLPAGVIAVEECDPLRDEGVNFYRLLAGTGVPVRCEMLVGMPHGGHLLYAAVPEVTLSVARSIVDLAVGSHSISEIRSKL